MPVIRDYSIEELKAEIERREKVEKKQSIPNQLAGFDILPLRQICKDYIEWQASDDYHVDTVGEFEYQIFDTALQAIYGKEIFVWLRSLR